MKENGLAMGWRNSVTTSGRKGGWVKRARLGDIGGGEGAKEEPGLLWSMSASTLQIAFSQSTLDLDS